MASEWTVKPIKNVLLDINGVLYDCGEPEAIKGSIDALDRCWLNLNYELRLVNHGYNFCLVTNECSHAKRLLCARLKEYGFHHIDASRIISPAPVACKYLCDHNLRPRLHVWDGLLEDFSDIIQRTADCKDGPNCLVIGDAAERITRDFVDESLELMLNSREEPVIITLGAGRYFKESGRIRMDTGAYAAAFEYCLNTKAVNIRKPSAEFFQMALDRLGGNVDDTVMIGDDIVSDVGGAMRMGMRAFQVRTGKFKESELQRLAIRPSGIFDNLSQAVDAIIKECPLSATSTST